MKIKFNKTTSLVYFLIILIFLLDVNFLMLIPVTGVIQQVNNYVNKYLIVGIIFFLCIYLLPFITGYVKKRRSLILFIFYVLGTVFFISIISMIKYNENILDVFTCWHHYLVILMVFPLIYIIKKEKCIDGIERIIIVLSILYCMICLFQQFVYLKSGSIVLPGLTESDYSFRNGYVRLRGSNLHAFAFIFMCSRFFTTDKNNRKKKIIYILGIIIEIMAQLYAYLTRSFIVVYLAIMIVIYFGANKRQQFSRIFAVTAVGGLSLQFIDIGSFIESFSINSIQGTGLSTLNRLEAASYFLSVFLKKPLYGNGFIRDSRIDLVNVLHGPYGLYSYSDIGFLGLLGETGVLGGSLYIILLLYLSRKTIKILKNKKSYSGYSTGVVVGILSFLIFTSPTLIVTNPENIIDIPLALSIVYGISEYYFQKI